MGVEGWGGEGAGDGGRGGHRGRGGETERRGGKGRKGYEGLAPPPLRGKILSTSLLHSHGQPRK